MGAKGAGESNGKALIPAVLAETTWQTVAQALLEQKTIKVTDLSHMTLHPQGIVSRHSVTYESPQVS